MILTIDLTNVSPDDIGQFRNEVATKLGFDHARIKNDLDRFWYYVSDENETKQQMQIWCHGVYEVYIQFHNDLKQGVNQIDLRKISPTQKVELIKLINSKLHDLYRNLQHDIVDYLNYNTKQDKKIVQEMNDRLKTLSIIMGDVSNQFRLSGY